MQHEELARILKELRRRPLFDGGGRPAGYRGRALENLLPHRPPFLLVDAVDGLDLERRTIRGQRTLAKDDPVFAGHFPGQPVYPGVLQIEVMGQLAICLAGLLAGGQVDAAARVRMTRILHAVFLEPLFPGDALTVHASVVEDDGLVVVTAGQIYKGLTLSALAVQEGCYVD